MENLGDAKNLGCFEHGAGEKRIALGVVGKAAGWRAIERIAVEIGLIFDKVGPHAALADTGDDRCESILIVKGNGDAAHDRRWFGKLGLAVTRQVDADLMAQRGQGAGQRSDYVGQSAGLGIGNAFGSDERDVHEGGTSWSTDDFRAAAESA